MENEDWQEIVVALVDAKRRLRAAWGTLDGTDGAADGVEHAFASATTIIDSIYAIESAHAFNADVCRRRVKTDPSSPVEI